MRPIDWERVLKEQGVAFIEKGPNVKRGEINVQCPFCGSADPSKHMGLSLETGWWSCWRNRAAHSGKSPLRLLMRLLRVPYERAREIAGLGEGYVDPEGFDAAVARFMGRTGLEGRPEQAERRFLKPDRDFALIENWGASRRHYRYLRDRGFDREDDDVDHLVREYGLMYSVSGYWSSRVIIPYYQDGQLVTWTARALGPSTARYLDLSIEDSLLKAKETLYNHDCMLDGGEVLVVQEGPVDALKVDFYGRAFGVRSVALSTNSATEAQAFLLQGAVGKFGRVLVMMDNSTVLGIADSMRMKESLSFLPNLGITKVPFGAKDGGALSPAEVIDWSKTLTKEKL